MGISTHFYTVYGTKVPYDDEFGEAYDLVYDDTDTPHIIFDGDGGYVILGKNLFDSGDLRWGEFTDMYTEVDIEELPAFEIEYKKKKFLEKFPQFPHLVEHPFKIITLAHYS